MISHDNEDKTNNNNIYEQKFLMMVREIYISDKIIGYYFYFRKIKFIKEFNKIKTINDKTKINNSLIKYSDYLEDIYKNNKTTISHKNIIFNPNISI